MILTLEVTGQQAANLGASRRKEFRRAGGTIGRAPDNDWVLIDPYISGRHARVQFRNETYFLEDTSTNGVYLNSPDNRLQRGKPYPLKAGDCIFMDTFEIRVGFIEEHAPAEPFAPARIGSVEAGRPAAPAIPDDPFGMGPADDPLVGSVELDPLKLVGGESRRPQRAITPAPKAADLARGSPLDQHYRPPEVVAPLIPEELDSEPASGAQSGMIPPDFDPFAPEGVSKRSTLPSPPRRPSAPQARPVAEPMPPPAQARPRRAPTQPPAHPPQMSPPPRAQSQVSPLPPAPQRGATPPPNSSTPMPPTPPLTANFDFANLLDGAGLHGVAVSPELARDFGEILRVVISGLMDLLRARERIKDEFRMRLTTFKPVDNNPLKFSANVEDALHNLLVKRNPAYLAPVEAFEDAFRDVRNHQVATLAGVRVAFESMLREFDPERLQEEYDREIKKGGFLGVPARPKYWDLYREQFRGRVKDADSCFRELFGDEFARAYQEQLEKVRDPPRSGGK
jgi:type VI secretion system FHA domain protein